MNKMFTKGAIIEMVIAALCLAGGLVIIIFNIIIYPKFKSLIYSIIGLFAIILILATIGVRLILKYRNARDNNEGIEALSPPELLSESDGIPEVSEVISEAAPESDGISERMPQAVPPNAKNSNKDK